MTPEFYYVNLTVKLGRLEIVLVLCSISKWSRGLHSKMWKYFSGTWKVFAMYTTFFNWRLFWSFNQNQAWVRHVTDYGPSSLKAELKLMQKALGTEHCIWHSHRPHCGYSIKTASSSVTVLPPRKLQAHGLNWQQQWWPMIVNTHINNNLNFFL